MADTVRVTLESDRLPVTPGQAASLGVRIYNAARIVDELVVVAVGLDESWVRTTPPSISLLPDSEGTVRVNITIPRDAPLAVGDQLIGIKVTSVGTSGASRVEELTLDIAPIRDAAIIADPQLVRGGRSSDFRVRVDNRGNQPLALELEGQDAEAVVKFDFTPPLLDVPPRASATARLKAVAPRALTGNEVQRALTINARGNGTDLLARVTFAQKPWLTRGVLMLVPLLLALAVAGVALGMRGGDGESAEPGTTTSTEGATTTSISTSVLLVKRWEHAIELKRAQVSYYLRPSAQGKIDAKATWTAPPTNLRAETRTVGAGPPPATKAGKSPLTVPEATVSQAAADTGGPWRVSVSDESSPPPAGGVLPAPTKGNTEISYPGGSGKGPFPFELSFARGTSVSIVVLGGPGTVSATTDLGGQVTMRLYRAGEANPLKDVTGGSLTHEVTKSQFDSGRTWWVQATSSTVGTASMKIEHR
jgi:hypothetical protein